MRKLQTGDLEGALSDYNKAIEISPNFIEAYIDRASTRERMGDEKGAKADFEKAEELRKRGVDHVLEDMDKEIEADPKAAKKILDRALYKYHKHDYKGAVEDFDRYLEIVGKHKGWLVYHHKTIAQEALGDIQGAIDTYSEWIGISCCSADAHPPRVSEADHHPGRP